MSLILAYQNRGLTRDIVINDAAGDPITVGQHDDVRASVGRAGQSPLLTVGATSTAAGSSFRKNWPSSGINRLRLDATDLAAISPGVYTLFVDYYDNADGQEWKNVDRQVFVLEET